MAKDNFSAQANEYAAYRPTYPTALYEYLASLATEKTHCWDVGTGNGQMAFGLSPFFEIITASDISEKQLNNAILRENITYTLANETESGLPDNDVDLVTVAQAIHWFDFENFYKEVRRVSKEQGIIAIIGYSLFRTDTPIDEQIDHFYKNVIGPYWDPERRYVDEEYRSIPFPFQEIKTPKFEMKSERTFDELIGYLNTWSAVQHYIRKNQKNPVEMIRSELIKAHNVDEKISIRFPLHLRVGRIK